MRRTRAFRPNTQRTLVLIVGLVMTIAWLFWMLGRTRWWRSIVLLASVLTFAFFALGWSAR